MFKAALVSDTAKSGYVIAALMKNQIIILVWQFVLPIKFFRILTWRVLKEYSPLVKYACCALLCREKLKAITVWDKRVKHTNRLHWREKQTPYRLLQSEAIVLLRRGTRPVYDYRDQPLRCTFECSNETKFLYCLEKKQRTLLDSPSNAVGCLGWGGTQVVHGRKRGSICVCSRVRVSMRA